MSDFKLIWDEVKVKLKESMNSDSYQRWIAGIVPLSLKELEDRAVCRLGIPNGTFADWLVDNYLSDIIVVLQDVTGALDVEVVFEDGYTSQDVEAEFAREEAEKAEKAASKAKAAKVAKAKKVTESRPAEDTEEKAAKNEKHQTVLNKHYTFENFVVGESNEFCHAACQAVAKAPGHAYNPLFIYGGVGLGKTHLVQAIAHQLLAKKKRAKVECLTSEEFLNIYVEAMSQKRLPSFRRHFRSLDLLVIDDVQFFAGKEKFQEEFFHTFNTLYNAHKQVVLTSDKPPHELDGLAQRLVSRFEWGLSTEVSVPDLETRMAILKQKQETQKVKVSDDIIYYIAERISTNVRRLEGALMKLISYVSLTKQEVTVELVNRLLGAIFEEEVSTDITVEKIQKAVAEFFDIRVSDILGAKRAANIAGPRQVAMFLSRKLTTLSTPEIGEQFGRNHATILHAVQKVEKDISKDENFRHTVNRLERHLRSYR